MDDYRDKTPPEVALRYRVAGIEDRLKDGAKTFASIRRMVWWVVGLAVGSLATVGGMLFRTGAFVEQAEDTRATVRDTQQELNVVKSEVRGLDTAQRLLGKDIEEVKAATTRIERKLDGPQGDPITGRTRPRR